MKNTVISLLALLCMLHMPLPLMAEVREARGFSVDVPEGWSIGESNGMVLVMGPGNKCVVTFGAQPSEGMDAQSVAGNMARILKGSEPLFEPETRGYSFTSSVGGVPADTLVLEHEGVFLFFTVTGDEAGHKEAVARIWRSLDSKDGNVRALLGK